MADEPEKKQEKAGDAAAPEVEAELVDDAIPGEDAAAFDAAPDDASEDTSGASPAKPKTLTPGVWLFIGFVVVALALVGLWRFLPAGEETSPQEAQSDVAAPEAAQPEPALADEAPLEDTPSAAPVENAAAPETGEQDAESDAFDSGKIGNDDVASAADAIKEETSDAAPGDVFLPPVGGDHADILNDETIKEAAKLAANEMQPSPVTPEDETAPSADNVIEGFEIETAPEAETPPQLPEMAVAEAPDHTEPAHTQPASPLAADPEMAAKITNEVASLKEAFRERTDELREALDDERQRSVSLEEEIRAMREDFAAALAVRDERDAEMLSDLRAQLEKIENDEGSAPGKLAVGAAALQTLRRAAEGGGPYARELQTLVNLVPDAAPLAALRPYAGEGAPTAMSLKEEFGPAARAGLAAAGQDQANGFWGRLSARVKSLVSMRPATAQSGDGPQAVMSRAEASVLDGDFGAALAELDALPQSAQDAMGGWAAGARARAEVDAALTALDAYFLDGSAG